MIFKQLNEMIYIDMRAFNLPLRCGNFNETLILKNQMVHRQWNSVNWAHLRHRVLSVFCQMTFLQNKNVIAMLRTQPTEDCSETLGSCMWRICSLVGICIVITVDFKRKPIFRWENWKVRYPMNVHISIPIQFRIDYFQ